MKAGFEVRHFAAPPPLSEILVLSREAAQTVSVIIVLVRLDNARSGMETDVTGKPKNRKYLGLVLGKTIDCPRQLEP